MDTNVAKNTNVVKVGCKVLLEKVFGDGRPKDEREYLIVEESDISQAGTQISMSSPIWGLIRSKPEGFSTSFGPATITIKKIINLDQIKEEVAEKGGSTASKEEPLTAQPRDLKGETIQETTSQAIRPQPAQVERVFPTRAKVNPLSEKEIHWKSWRAEMSSRTVLTGSNTISYSRYITKDGVSDNAILGFMKELYDTGNNLNPHGDAWKTEICSVVVSLIRNGLSDVNYLDGGITSVNDSTRNTPLSYALEKGLSEAITCLLSRPDIDVNKCYTGFDKEKHHPYEKITQYPENIRSIIMSGAYTLLFANQKLDLSFEEWEKLFNLVKKEIDNNKNVDPKYYLTVLDTLNTMLNNPRFKERIAAHKEVRRGRPSDFTFGQKDEIRVRAKTVKSIEDKYRIAE